MVHIKVTEAYNAIIPASQPAYPIAQAIRAFKFGFVNDYKPDLFAYTTLIDLVARIRGFHAACEVICALLRLSC